MGEEVAVAGSEDEAGPELERIFAELVLAVARSAGAPACSSVVATKQVQQIGGGQTGGAVRLSLFIDEQRKRNTAFFAEEAGVTKVAEADGGQAGSFGAEGGLVFAQLGDVLAAEDSAVVTEEDDDGGRIRPQRAKLHGLLVAIG